MKISTNNIGNYAPKYIPEIQIKSKPTVIQEDKKAESITPAEKEFFVEMYPQNKGEIKDYHFYQRSGKMSGVSVGSLFDKKG